MALDLGDQYRCSYTNTTPAGGNASSGNMALTIVLPDDTTTVIDPVAPVGTGVYVYDYQTVQAGHHVAQWRGTGINPGAHVETFDVHTLTPGYLVSLAVMKEQLKLTTTATDEVLRGYIESATSGVERIRGEAIVKRTFVDELYLPEYFSAGGLSPGMTLDSPSSGRSRIALNHSPVISLTSIARVDGAMTWDVSNMRLDPDGIVEVLYGPSLGGHITVTYVAGYRVIPAEFSLATQFIVEHLWQTRRGAKGSVQPGLGTTSVPGLGYAVPNAAIELLGSGIPGFA